MTFDDPVAQIDLARIRLDLLLDDFREGFHSPGELQDRVREVLQVLVAAVPAVDPARGGDGLTSGVEGFALPHDDSPSVGGPDTPTVGAPGAVAPVAAPGTPPS